MTRETRIEMIQDYANKVKMYPKGSKGYDPVDLMNLDYAVNKHLEVMRFEFQYCKCENPTEIVPGYNFCAVCSARISSTQKE